MNCDVVQGARTESKDGGLSLIDSLVDGVGPPSHMYFVGKCNMGPVIVAFPGQGHARGADVHSSDVRNLGGILEDTRGVKK